MKINTRTVPHHKQRFGQCGDWWVDPDGIYQVRVSFMSNSRFQLAVVLHEIIEAVLCKELGIPESAVDAFDETFEGDGEPGDDASAPYYNAHVTASICERAIAHCLNIDWNEYSKAIEQL